MRKIADACYFAAFVLCALSFVPITVWAGPITFNTALPVAKGHWLVRQQLPVRNRDDHT